MFVCREQVELCVDILERILVALSPVCVVQNYRAELQAGLGHPQDTVKVLALTQVSSTLQPSQPRSQTSGFISLSIRLAELWSTPTLPPKSSTTVKFSKLSLTALEKRRLLLQNR